MNRLKAIAASLLVCVGLHAQTAAQLLIDRLDGLRKYGIMIGQQDATVYGST